MASLKRLRRKFDHKGFEAVPAVVVADQTNKRGKRLGQAAIALLLLFFAMGGYIQSAQNGVQLNHAAHQRGQLIDSVQSLTKANRTQVNYIKRLQQTLAEQNKLLRRAGIPVVDIPPPPNCCKPSPKHRSSPKSSPSPRSSAKPSSSPTHTQRPPPSSSPSPEPTDVTKTVCRLTKLCLSSPLVLFKLF